MSVEISVIELVLMHAAQRGVLDEDAVIAAVDRMWSAHATLQEAAKIPQTTPQEKESKMAQALEEFNEASKDVVALLNRAARGG
jgi:enoyl-CoA hydratase/carnithine racemase